MEVFIAFLLLRASLLSITFFLLNKHLCFGCSALAVLSFGNRLRGSRHRVTQDSRCQDVSPPPLPPE